MRNEIPENNKNSRLDKSTGALRDKALENPNITFIHERKKKVGPNKYKNTSKKIDNNGKRSKKKTKK